MKILENEALNFFSRLIKAIGSGASIYSENLGFRFENLSLIYDEEWGDFNVEYTYLAKRRYFLYSLIFGKDKRQIELCFLQDAYQKEKIIPFYYRYYRKELNANENGVFNQPKQERAKRVANLVLRMLENEIGELIQ